MIVVTTTLQDLEAAGKGLTAGGTLVPMSEVIRMASHAHHYLAIFDHGKALALYHTKRLASPAQRIVLYAKDRGCTKPGCDVPAYHSQVHHVTGWQATRCTGIDDLTLACRPDNRLVDKGGFTTRTNSQGDTDGYHRPTWTMANLASTRSITPKNYWHPTMTNPIDVKSEGVVGRNCQTCTVALSADRSVAMSAGPDTTLQPRASRPTRLPERTFRWGPYRAGFVVTEPTR